METAKYKMIGLAGGLPIKDQPGRLSHEVARNKTDVIAILIGGIVKAQENMGIVNSDSDKIKQAAEAAIKKILEVYPGAMVADIVKALEMASFGQIKLPEQLNVVSAANIYNWYKNLRSEHSDKMSIPMYPPRNAMPEPTIDEKAQLIRDFFQKGITNPDSIIGGFDSTFRKIIALGLYSVNAQYMEDKFRSEMSRVSFAFKIVSAADQKKKGQLIQLQNHINTVYKDSKIDFKVLQVDENFRDAFVLVSDSVKKEIVKEVMKTNTVESVMKLYDSHEQNR